MSASSNGQKEIDLVATRFSDSNVEKIIICNSCVDLLKLDAGGPVEPATRFCFAIAAYIPARQNISQLNLVRSCGACTNGASMQG
jgi:hypothetical protein